MRASTTIFGALALVLATAGITRAAGVVVDVRLFVVIALLITSVLLGLSAFAGREDQEQTDQ
ncbi:hypothetical protein QEV69_09025 [Trueperella pyogenes]|uniref:Uncharacterized protein n=1 Tax=Trueperella pyogenes TaxID=1661 RepID=X4R0X5_9ACTO|nr:hypothetical protein [Trueperella pyogenes]AHU90361.1 hypothetical protein CQ11_00885 [Trueperella pyogenes]ALD74311.1 hypothetical protein AN946_08355 [Trueperella pyogenes]AWA42691.1 hypothetical protein DBV13_00880 [Trueperella pyogenes]AWG04715.1 hypothetical protein DC090_09945 [Trueperella pyogenes]AWG15541.1 hypothetical protein DDE06_01090 [Trueperella pyogenes]